jgi:hypothetical protein
VHGQALVVGPDRTGNVVAADHHDLVPGVGEPAGEVPDVGLESPRARREVRRGEQNLQRFSPLATGI